MTRFIAPLLGLLMVSVASPALADHVRNETVQVDCDHGGTLNGALAEKADDQGPLTVAFKGTCREVVDIPRDDVTIRGLDSTATIVGRVTITGRVRTTLTGFTVRDTPPDPDVNGRLGDAVIFNSSLGAVVDHLTIIHPGGNGLTLDGTQLRLRDTTVTDCGGHGIASGLSSSVMAGGTIVADHCVGAGIQAGFGSQMTFTFDSVIEANDNGNWGILVQLQGQFTLFRGSHVTTLRNGIGIQVSNQGSLVHTTTTFNISQNRSFGILVGELSDWTPFAGLRPDVFTISGNGGAGIGVIRHSFMRLRSGVVVSGNSGPGLLVDDSAVAFQQTVIQGNNGGDVLLLFGSSATFDGGNSFGSPIVCDGTALSRGQFTCPANAATSAAQKARFERLHASAMAALP